MKKINGVNNKDRIICVSEATPMKMKVETSNKYKDHSYSKTVLSGRHTFYYQPTSGTGPEYLFSTKQFSPSVKELFAKKGVLISDNDNNQSYSISVGELYKLRHYHHNYILNKIINRIPMMIDNVIRYELKEYVTISSVSCKHSSEHISRPDTRYFDDQRAA